MMDEKHSKEKGLLHSFGQKAQWFIYNLYPKLGGYNINYTWQIDSNIQVDTFKEVTRLISNRHASIRTVYFEKEGSPFQKVLPQLPRVFAFQSPGIKDINALLTSVEDLADFYISELLDLLPQGPYQLGGASFGGMVALKCL